MFKFNREKFCKDYRCERGGIAEELSLRYEIGDDDVVNDILNDESFEDRKGLRIENYYEEIYETLDDFINGKMFVHCETKEEAEEFMEILKICGCRRVVSNTDLKDLAIENMILIYGCFNKTVFIRTQQIAPTIKYDDLVLPHACFLMKIDTSDFNRYFQTTMIFGGHSVATVHSTYMIETDEKWLDKGFSVTYSDVAMNFRNVDELNYELMRLIIDSVQKAAREYLMKRYENV